MMPPYPTDGRSKLRKRKQEKKLIQSNEMVVENYRIKIAVFLMTRLFLIMLEFFGTWHEGLLEIWEEFLAKTFSFNHQNDVFLYKGSSLRASHFITFTLEYLIKQDKESGRSLEENASQG